MGIARIVSGGLAGQYTIEVLHNRQRIEAELGRITERLPALESRQAELQELLDYADLEVAEVSIYVDALIDRLEEEGTLAPVDLPLLVMLHNQKRSSPLVAVSSLNQAAQAHATWLAANDTSGHAGPGGNRPEQRAAAAGYLGVVGENVAVGVLPPENNALDAWMNSPGHRQNLLDTQWQHIGLGYDCRNDGRHQHFWVAVFGRTVESVSASDPAAPGQCEGTDGDVPELIREALEELSEKARTRDLLRLDVAQADVERINLQKRLEALQQIPGDPVYQSWCADYTENLSGTVATAEIPGEGNARVLVRPGYQGRANPASSRDGQLFYRAGMTPEQAFLAAATLPGWQKWKPTYRVGLLTGVNKNADTCTVTLDYETSSAQSLPINQATTLTNVPIEYMDCNADVFFAGDRVLVEFFGQSWESSRVIGFASNPKPCAFWPIVQVALSARNDPWTGATIPDGGADRVYRFEDCPEAGYVRSRGFAMNTGYRPYRAFLDTSDSNHLRVLGGDESDTVVIPDNPVIWEYMQSADRVWAVMMQFQNSDGPWTELNPHVGVPVDLPMALSTRTYFNLGTAPLVNWILDSDGCPQFYGETKSTTMMSGITQSKYYGTSERFTLMDPTIQESTEFGPTDDPEAIFAWWLANGTLPEVKVVKEGFGEQVYQPTGMIRQQIESPLPMQAWYMIFEAPEDGV